jgi:hypothetical protein
MILVFWELVHGTILGVNLNSCASRAGRTTRCGHAYLMWLGALKLFPNLEPTSKISTQLVEPC